MKIAHVLRRLSLDHWGGIEQEVRHLAKAQREAGHDVRVFATDALGGEPRSTLDGVPVFRFPCVYPWWPMTAATKAALDRKGGNPFAPAMERELRAWRPDVVHCHSMGRLAQLCVR
ncbi:MAG: glycosyltransferase, partial [Kiritimatiellae bacterium]|nr:glycosyltransferase [Kiritimatiellia bacterium]